jgi:hypothetical protein
MASGDLTINKLINRLSVLKKNDNQNDDRIDLLEKDINLLSEKVNEIYYTSREGYLYTFTPEELSNNIKLSDKNFPKYVIDVYYRTIFFKDLNNSSRITRYMIYIPRKNDIKDYILSHLGASFNRDISIDDIMIISNSILSSTTGKIMINISSPGLNVYGSNTRKPGTYETNNYIIPIIEKEIKERSNIIVYAYSQGSSFLMRSDNIINYIANNHNLKEIIFVASAFNNYITSITADIFNATPGPITISRFMIIYLNIVKAVYLSTGLSPEDANKLVLLNFLYVFIAYLYNSCLIPTKFVKKEFIQLMGLYSSVDDFNTELKRNMGIVTGEEPIESLNFDYLFYLDELNGEEFENFKKTFTDFNKYKDDYNFPSGQENTIVHLFNDEIIPYVAVDENTGEVRTDGNNQPGTVNNLQFDLKYKFNEDSKIINDDNLTYFQRKIFDQLKNSNNVSKNPIHYPTTHCIAVNYITDNTEYN